MVTGSLPGRFHVVTCGLLPPRRVCGRTRDNLPDGRMNTPRLNNEISGHGGLLQVFAFFHLNLAFSSIEEERRDEVIARCYWPLLRLAHSHAPIGIEVSGFTLEEIARR